MKRTPGELALHLQSCARRACRPAVWRLSGAGIQLHVCACWRGLPPSHMAVLLRGGGVNVASPTGSSVDLRPVAGVRQKGEVLWVGRDHYNGNLCEGVLVAVCSGTGSTELFAVHAGCFVLKTRDVTTIVLSTCKLFRTTVLPVALASFVARPLSDGCRLACRRTPCCMPSRESTFRWLLMLHAFGLPVLSTSRWRAFRPHRLESQAAPGGTGLPFLLAGSRMYQYMRFPWLCHDLWPCACFAKFAPHRAAGKLRLGC